MCGSVQMESRCGHMSILWFGQTRQLGLRYVSDQKMFFLVVSHVFWHIKI